MGEFDKIKNREKFMRGWKKFLLVFAIVLVFVSVPVLFIILNVNGKVYTREQAYALANKVCEDLEISGGVHSQTVSNYTGESMPDEMVNYVKNSGVIVSYMRDVLAKTELSESSYYKWIGPQHDFYDEDEDGDTDEMIDWDYYYFKYKFIKNGVSFDFINILHGADQNYKIAITLTESSNGWDFDYYMTDYFVNEVVNKNDLKSSFVYNVHASAENGKVYSGCYAEMVLASKNLYKNGNIVVGDCSSFKYESVNTKTKKMESISTSEAAEANKVITSLIDSVKGIYSVSFENINAVDLHMPY